METNNETATAAKAEFDKFIVESGVLDDDSLGKTGLEILYGVFWAGVAYGIRTQSQKPLESPNTQFKGQRRVWPKRKPGEIVTVKDPNSQATDAQYRYLKSLVGGDEAKARGIMSREEYDKVFSDIGVFTKGEASDLIDRLVKAGIKPKRNR